VSEDKSFVPSSFLLLHGMAMPQAHVLMAEMLAYLTKRKIFESAVLDLVNLSNILCGLLPL